MAKLFSAFRTPSIAVPVEYRDEFSRMVLHRNLLRVRVICWTMLIGLVVFCIVDFFTLEARGGVSENFGIILPLLTVRIITTLFTVGYLIMLGSLSGPDSLKKIHRGKDMLLIVVYMIYMGTTLGYMYSFRTDLSIYLVFVLIASSFLVWTRAQSFLVLGSAFVSVAVSLPFFGASFSSYKYSLVSLGVMTGVSYGLAQVGRRNLIQEFLDKKTIQRQNVELALERAEAEKAREIAVEASQAKSDFLASMSHEIRTPMNAVLGMTEVTLETELTKDQRRYLDTALDSAQQLMAIINDILDFSKIEAGKMSVEHIDFDLYETLESTLTPFRSMGAAKGLTIDLDIAEGTPRHCKGDPVRLRQVLMNLLSNAVKFTDDGSVILRAMPEVDGGETQMMRLTVVDTGIGVPEEKQQTIFERFSQADSSTTREYGGTGLGLAISRQLALLMGGFLEYAPGTEKGSIFTFVIPLDLAEGPVQTLRSRPTLQSVKRLRVLLVDDNTYNRQVAGTQLELLGHACVRAESGKQALEYLVRQPFDLVCMDIEMPGMDGFETTRIIRQGGPAGDWSEELRSIPVFALTAHAVEDIRARAVAEGMSDFLPKPIRMATLQKVLNRFADELEINHD